MKSDLFTTSPGYPAVAGYKTNGHDKSAAQKIERTGKAALLRERVVMTLKSHGPMTADECAKVMKEDVLSVRPRFSQLARTALDKHGNVIRPALIEKTDLPPRDSCNGNPQGVYRVIGGAS